MTTFETVTEPVYRENVFSLQMEETKLTRYIDPMEADWGFPLQRV